MEFYLMESFPRLNAERGNRQEYTDALQGKQYELCTIPDRKGDTVYCCRAHETNDSSKSKQVNKYEDRYGNDTV